MGPCYHRAKTASSGPPTRDLSDLALTTVALQSDYSPQWHKSRLHAPVVPKKVHPGGPLQRKPDFGHIKSPLLWSCFGGRSTQIVSISPLWRIFYLGHVTRLLQYTTAKFDGHCFEVVMSPWSQPHPLPHRAHRSESSLGVLEELYPSYSSLIDQPSSIVELVAARPLCQQTPLISQQDYRQIIVKSPSTFDQFQAKKLQGKGSPWSRALRRVSKTARELSLFYPFFAVTALYNHQAFSRAD